MKYMLMTNGLSSTTTVYMLEIGNYFAFELSALRLCLAPQPDEIPESW